MSRQKISPYSNIAFSEVKKLQEENEKLKNTLRNIRFYLVDKICSLSKVIQVAGNNEAVVSDLKAKDEAYSDILVYIERKGLISK